MKSVFFAIAIALLVIAQINSYSVICKYHFIPEKDYSCQDFQNGVPGLRVRTKDLTIMNPLIKCKNVNKKVIKKDKKVCVAINFKKENKTVETIKIEKNETCKDINEKAGLKENQAYILENYNKNILNCERIAHQVGNEIDYCTDGNYNPDFRKSKRVYKL